MTQQQLDIVTFAVVLAAVFFSPEVAEWIGPYVVIILASTVGASFSLARRETSSRLSALWFFLRVNGLAILLTVALAAVVRSWRPELHERVLLAPIALLVGYIGDDWPKLLGRIVKVLFEALNKFKGGPGNG